MSSIAELKDDSGAVIYPKTVWEAIQNKPDLNSPNLAETTVSVPASGGFTASTFTFMRQANLCLVSGVVKITAAVNGEIFPKSLFPSGFAPFYGTQVNATMVSIMGGSQKMTLHANGSGGLTLMTVSGATSDTANFTIMYFTKESFPNQEV